MSAERKIGVAMKQTQETRLALLEQSNDHIYESLERLEKSIEKNFESTIKQLSDINRTFEKVTTSLSSYESRIWTNFYWILGTMFTLSCAVGGVLAKGFGWV